MLGDIPETRSRGTVHMRTIAGLCLGLMPLAAVRAQPPVSTSKDRSRIEQLVGTVVGDSSFIHRYVALDELRHASPQLRSRAAAALSRALAEPGSIRRRRVLDAIEAIARDAGAAIPALSAIVDTPSDSIRGYAIYTLANV